MEFFRLVRSRMTHDGLLMMNVLDVSPERSLLASAGATLLEVFPSVEVWSQPDGSHVVFASCRERTVEEIRAKLRGWQDNSRLGGLIRAAAAEIVSLKPPAGTLVFTDDRAPVEEITRRMLLASGTGRH